jgi:hypothetical protein
MRRLLLSLPLSALFLGLVMAQQSSQVPTAKPQNHDVNVAETLKGSNAVTVYTGVASTARIADPNEPVVFSGRVMKMADFVAAVSSSNEVIQHLHSQEKRSRETAPPTPPSKP